MTVDYEALARRLAEAVNYEGKQPRYHRNVLARHRVEWPSLWRVIDEIRQAVEADTPSFPATRDPHQAMHDVLAAAFEWQLEWDSEHPAPDPTMKAITRDRLIRAVRSLREHSRLK